ncbi:acyltransferase family protein [Sediminibacterium ginsengisoli]|uniref:Acyltransferase family protein n=1 Tax=Sediminibacterium ginsengisoli TaxID=413434 RepID=A0A1T4N782_9BACT|nr:acyltransferase family protein [Sediminibacterium ginsengisoli]SJZ75119.1 Acyltransferase family protein [Sediminibacterium ginsengisoli]
MNRRYDIDWLRVIAIGLLLIYHTAIAFQPWGPLIGFITNNQSWESLWLPMTMLNVWRIPILFFISGMGVCLAFRRKTWRQLLQERFGRILIPFLFGFFTIVPLQAYIAGCYYQQRTGYMPGAGHLWFLGNIFLYLLLLLPAFWFLKKSRHAVSLIQKISTSLLFPFMIMGVFMIETLIVQPVLFELYAMTMHGFALGLTAFFFGFCFILGGDPFLRMLLKWRWLFLVMSLLLYACRLNGTGNTVIAAESVSWVFAVLAFGYHYLNRPGRLLRYLSQAAYPVYIVHMLFLYLASLLVFPMTMPVALKFILVLLLTCAGCFAFYGFVIRRIKLMRMLFGLKSE